jgi:hypothetical protein
MAGIGDDLVSISSNTYTTLHPDCPTSCVEKCKGYPVQPLRSIDCDIPCNVGIWKDIEVSDAISLDRFGCPNCSMIITYRSRQTDETCVPQYVDVEMLDIEFVGSGCGSCNLSPVLVTIHELAINWLLQNVKAVQDLGINDCITSLRVLTQQCWQINLNYMEPCFFDRCCWGTYLICTDGQGNLKPPVLLELQSSGTWSNCNPAYICELVCDAFPDPDLFPAPVEDENSRGLDKTFVVPNPATGEINIHVLSGSSGDHYIKIFDIKGNLYSEEKIKINSSESIINVDIQAWPSGGYLYKIFKGNKVLLDGSFIKSE